ncbi:hypothetical protein DPMN_050103 [Dreissena polymorpha]|uniref:Uncharacterized protein n=1 Tax=Dreissena polymorpha TaxID=45954 RepID=A0A9D4HL08_DREPO|nr:hypothetical protein DPMN_050103 [Dreissena polymorpha]
MKKSAIQIAEDDAVDVDEPEVATSVAPPVKLRCADDSGENGAVIDCGDIFRKTDGLSQGNDVGEQEAKVCVKGDSIPYRVVKQADLRQMPDLNLPGGTRLV